MTDRRLFRRHLAGVGHSDASLGESAAAAGATMPFGPEAILDELSLALAPIVSQFSGAAPDPDEVRCLLAGWVH